MKQRLRTILAPLIVMATIAAFVYYLKTHPEAVSQIRSLPIGILLILLTLYFGFFLALAFLTQASLRVYDRVLGRQENMLFNAYSLLINFFGPGQSGPAFRGLYLKKRHGLEYKKYLFVTLIYYAFYAMFSALMMFVGTRPWWQTVILIIGVGAVSWSFIHLYKKRSKITNIGTFKAKNLGLIFGAALIQVVIMATIFGIELNNVGANASMSQVLAYTGVSNFSLFVAITPGAIGIREAFLVFSQDLHHIGSSTIVAANVIDRAVYLLFLGLLFILVVSLHAKDKLNLKQLKINEK